MPPQPNEKLMAIFRAAIAYHNLKVVDLVKELPVARNRFSEMLNCQRHMPSEISEQLIEILGLGNALKRCFSPKRENVEKMEIQ